MDRALKPRELGIARHLAAEAEPGMGDLRYEKVLVEIAFDVRVQPLAR